MPGGRWLSARDFESYKWARRAERLAAPKHAYICEKCGMIGVPKSEQGYENRQMIHENGPWHLLDGKVNPDVCRGRVAWKEKP